MTENFLQSKCRQFLEAQSRAKKHQQQQQQQRHSPSSSSSPSPQRKPSPSPSSSPLLSKCSLDQRPPPEPSTSDRQLCQEEAPKRPKRRTNLPSPERDAVSIDSVEVSSSVCTSSAEFVPERNHDGENNDVEAFDVARRSRSNSSDLSFVTARDGLRRLSSSDRDVSSNGGGLVTKVIPATPPASDSEVVQSSSSTRRHNDELLASWERLRNYKPPRWLMPEYRRLDDERERKRRNYNRRRRVGAAAVAAETAKSQTTTTTTTTSTTSSPTKTSRVKLNVKTFKNKIVEKWALVKKSRLDRSPGASSDSRILGAARKKKPAAAAVVASSSNRTIVDRGYSSDSEVNNNSSASSVKGGSGRVVGSGCARWRKTKKRAGSPRPKLDIKNSASSATLVPLDTNDRDEEIKDLNSSATSLVPSDVASESLNSSAVDVDYWLEEQDDEEELLRPDSADFFDKLRGNFRDKIEEIKRYFQKSSRLADVNRRLKSQIWSSVVTIVLIQAKNLIPMDIDGTSDPYVKFRLGVEKYKSKVIAKTLNPMWLEQFDLHLYEEGQELEVTVWDRDKSRHQDDLMGRVVIDLAQLEREKTHSRWHELDDGAGGSIYLLLTISGTTASETISDLASHEETPQEKQLLLQKYSLGNTFQRFRDVGHLTVKVYRAQGLVAADLGGKSDPFCVLELVNSRLQTQTEYKTLTPNWQKIFTFNVKDINSVLEVTVYDEDRDHKVEFLGKVAIPLLRVKNGLKRWYALKDKKLRCRAKGNSPQILLEMNVVWNAVRASYRTLNPKEKKFMEPETKFKRQIFIRNVVRLKSVVMWFYDCGKYIQSCWEWEYKMRSSIALVLFVVGTYYFEPWMVPTLAFLIIFYYYLMSVHLHDSVDGNEDGPPTPGEDDEDDEDKDKEEKKSLRETFQAIQEVTQTVQNSMGYIASLCEKVKNLFNFTVPYLSCLVMLLTVCAAIILFLVPLRYLILLWGINKFTKKIIRPHSVPNNELLDLISRVPDDEELLNYRELRPSPTADGEGRDGAASPSSPTGSLSRRELRRRQQQQKQQQAQNQSQA
ncbi:multiple C2 and transmembrane domain-containing protein isoform X2 [Trichogramma pretiosum]|uniref:multiple C2 and transmembrane domain-containing protein isoform X2 n=1 Tax=Trichogramma pretiosum TaxID=7493 RepID=UPI000C719163|nr:multiple C2 and transmembrane domain-containing protein isoform X2 [Trichogramma pretiosum]